MSMKFAAIKVQRALRRVELAQHALYMPIPYDPNELPGSNDVHVQTRPDLPRMQQPAAKTVRNGAIYMKSRNVPAKGIRPGMVLLLDLGRAASVLADDTYEIANEQDIARELERQQHYREEMKERDRQLRMQSQGIENNITFSAPPQQPMEVKIVWPENMQAGSQQGVPAGYKLVPVDTPEPVRRRRRKAATADTDAQDADSQ